MTVGQAAKLIGTQAKWDAGNGLLFDVIIEDVKVAYGNTRYVIRPVTGGNQAAWVQAGVTVIQSKIIQ